MTFGHYYLMTFVTIERGNQVTTEWYNGIRINYPIWKLSNYNCDCQPDCHIIRHDTTEWTLDALYSLLYHRHLVLPQFPQSSTLITFLQRHPRKHCKITNTRDTNTSWQTEKQYFPHSSLCVHLILPCNGDDIGQWSLDIRHWTFLREFNSGSFLLSEAGKIAIDSNSNSKRTREKELV